MAHISYMTLADELRLIPETSLTTTFDTEIDKDTGVDDILDDETMDRWQNQYRGLFNLVKYASSLHLIDQDPKPSETEQVAFYRGAVLMAAVLIKFAERQTD